MIGPGGGLWTPSILRSLSTLVSLPAPVNVVAPSFSGTAVIGQTLTATPGTWSDANTVTGNWQRDGFDIPLQTGLTYVLQPEDDNPVGGEEVTISYRETATNGGSVAFADSGTVAATYVAPVAGSADDIVLETGTGTQVVDLSDGITGGGLVFTLGGDAPAGVTSSGDGGLISVDTTAALAQTSFTVRGTNSGGFAETTVKITVEAIPDQVLDFDGSSGMTQAFGGFDFDGAGSTSLDTSGFWMGAYVFFDGGSYDDNAILLSFISTTVATRHMYLKAGAVAGRNQTTRQTPALATPTDPGWYLCIGQIKKAAPTNKADLTFWRNDEVSGPVEEFLGGGFATVDEIGLGYFNTTVDLYSDMPGTSFAWGHGDPTAMQAWAYNNGDFRDIRDYDFDSDANATIEGYWAGNRVGDASAFDPLDVTDEVGPLDTFTEVGAMEWADRSPPWASGGVLSIASATIEDANRDQLVVVANNSRGDIVDPPTVSFGENNFDVWSEQGFGPIRIQSASSVVSGTQVTVTMTLNRDIHASETIRYEVLPTWFDDGLNTGGLQEGDGVNNSTLADPATSTGLSYGRVAVEFDAAYAVGFYEDGLGYVVDGGSGVHIIDTYPSPATAVDGREITGTLRAVHGGQKNPRYLAYQHGYDGRNQASHTVKYNPALNDALSLPLSLSTHDSFIKARSNVLNASENGGSSSHPVFLKEIWGLHVVSSAPAANEFCPPLVGYDGTSARPTMALDVAATVAALPSYSTAGHDRPPVAEVISRVKRFNPIGGQIRAVEDRRHMTPAFITQSDGYGLKMAETMNAAALCLIGDDIASAKEDIVRGLAQNGWQWYNCFTNESVNMTPDGGHAQYHQFPMILATYWAGLSAAEIGAIADKDKLAGNLFGQTFKIDATILSDVMDPHGTAGEALPQDNKPYATHRKEITAISSNVVTIGNADAKEIGTGATNPKTYFLHLRLRQESDGYTSRITAIDQAAQQYTVEDGSGFIVGQTVYVIPVQDAVIGEYDWSLGGHPYNGIALGPDTSYRNLNNWTGQTLAIKALGLMHTKFEAFEGYVIRANDPDNPVGFDYPYQHSTYNRSIREPGVDRFFRWDQDFWDEHWTAISAVSSVI